MITDMLLSSAYNFIKIRYRELLEATICNKHEKFIKGPKKCGDWAKQGMRYMTINSHDEARAAIAMSGLWLKFGKLILRRFGDVINALFRDVAVILHLGNIEFANGKETGSSKLQD
ncbi:hypothetical protein Tco_0662393 [Tanacetum coccineum]